MDRNTDKKIFIDLESMLFKIRFDILTSRDIYVRWSSRITYSINI